MAHRVVEDIVGVAGDVDLADKFSRFRIEHDKLRRITAADKKPMVIFVERYGEISKGQASAPRCDHFGFASVDHGDVMRSGNVNEDSLALLLQRERLGVTTKFDRLDLF